MHVWHRREALLDEDANGERLLPSAKLAEVERRPWLGDETLRAVDIDLAARGIGCVPPERESPRGRYAGDLDLTVLCGPLEAP